MGRFNSMLGMVLYSILIQVGNQDAMCLLNAKLGGPHGFEFILFAIPLTTFPYCRDRGKWGGWRPVVAV